MKRNFIKTITALAVTAATALSITATVFAEGTFTDVPETHWAYLNVSQIFIIYISSDNINTVVT